MKSKSIYLSTGFSHLEVFFQSVVVTVCVFVHPEHEIEIGKLSHLEFGSLFSVDDAGSGAGCPGLVLAKPSLGPGEQ